MGTSTQFLNEMRRMIGVTESPLGSNRSAVGVAFGWNGVPWCAETVSLAAKRSGMDWWTASTDQMEAWARVRRNRSVWISRYTTPRPGDIAVWDYVGDGTANHVSVVESVRSDGMLITIGGNESNRCMRAVRSKSRLRGYIRLAFSVPVSSTPISTVHPTLQLGSTGAAVRELQNKLNVISPESKIAADGVFGLATRNKVINFQRFFRLTADGVVGPKTWAQIDYIYGLKT